MKIIRPAILLLLLYVGGMVSAQVMPDFVIRTAQEINARYGEGSVDINNTAWDWRAGSIGDNFPLTEGCNQPLILPATTNASGYYRVFFDTDFDGVDDWRVVVYDDYSYFGLCTAPQYQCGQLEPRLTVGSIAHVDPDGFPNNLRAQPGESGQLTGEIPAGAEFRVVDGPRCGSGISFWLVDYNGVQGWTAEGQGEGYWLLPGTVSGEGDPVPTAIPEPTTVPLVTCAGVTSRLYVGRRVQVTPGLPNNLRALPGESGDYLGEIPPGQPFEIVGGPECNSNLLWWQVNYLGTIGWTAEAGSPEDYWLEPISYGATPISPASLNLLTSVMTLTPQTPIKPLASYINERNEIFVIGTNGEVSWHPTDPALMIRDMTWTLQNQRTLQNQPLATRLDSGGRVVKLTRNPANNQLISLEGGTFFDEFDLSLNNTTLDIGAFHPDDGDMIMVSQRGFGFVLVNSNPESPTYRQVAQASRILLPSEVFEVMTFNREGTRLVGLTDADNMVIWQGLSADPATWEARYPIVTADNVDIRDVALSPDGSKLVIVGVQTNANSQSGFYATVDLTDAGASTPQFTYIGNIPVTAVEFSPDGSFYVVASNRNSIMFVNNRTDQQIRVFDGGVDEVADIAFNKDATLMITTSVNGAVTVWRVN